MLADYEKIVGGSIPPPARFFAVCAGGLGGQKKVCSFGFYGRRALFHLLVERIDGTKEPPVNEPTVPTSSTHIDPSPPPVSYEHLAFGSFTFLFLPFRPHWGLYR